jgi:hypothetical protein
VRVLRSQVTSLEADVALNSLPAGTGRFEILASDGFHTTRSVSASLAIGNHTPQLSVSGLISGQTLDLWAANAPAQALCAVATDTDDAAGFSPASTAWSWSGPESGSAAGCGVSLGRLFPGSYTLQASITDSMGATATTTLPFSVAVPEIPEAPDMLLDGIRDAAHYANAPVFDWPLTGGGSARASLSHHSGALWVLVENLPHGNGAVGAGILLNTSGDRSAGLDADDLAIECLADGSILLWTGASGSWQRAPAPAALIESAIFSGETHWAAEVRIPDAIVAGWDHAAALRLYAMRPWPYDAFPATSVHQDTSTWMPMHFGARPAAPVAPPTAFASGGASTAPAANEPFTMDGSASTAADGIAELAYAWTQLSGPTVSLTGADQPICTFTHGAVATATALSFQLIVSAGGVESAPVTVDYYFYPAPDTTPWPTGPITEGVVIIIHGDGMVDIEFDANYWFGPGGALAPPENNLPVVGAMFEIEASADLATWAVAARLPANAAGRIAIQDTSEALRKFYRLRRAPVP